MSDKAHFLITTADEQTWKFDRPVIFLGEWCRLYDRKHVWEKMDAIVAEPYGLGQQKKDEDHAQARALEEKLFPELCNILNEYHGTQYNERFWKIVLGHWFRRYIDIILNRVRTLQQCLDKYNISGSTIYNDINYDLSVNNSTDAIWATNNEQWNNSLNYKILLHLGFESLTQKKITSQSDRFFSFKRLLPITTHRYKLLIDLTSFYIRASQKLKKESSSLIISSYLPKKEVVKLQLKLRELPKNWTSPNLKITSSCHNKERGYLKSTITKDSRDSLEVICRALLFDLLPICYLEGFNELNHQVNQLPWPKTPKFIFTSNRFDTDELFKLWTAIKIENGASYIVGQHGNNYGTYRYMYPSIEESTSDKFLTWGWIDGLPQHTPAFILKLAGKKINNNPEGGLLLIEVCQPHRITAWDSTSEFAQYFLEQQAFVSKLNKIPRQTITIRLHAAYKYSNWSEEARWRDFDPSLSIETGLVKIEQLINQNRLVVHSYDSTGMLESLSQNIPTLAFWQNGFDHLRESAKPYYQILVDAGIVHLSTESIAQKVNEIWDNVSFWWSQPIVQNARKEFCSKYATTCINPASELKKILLE